MKKFLILFCYLYIFIAIFINKSVIYNSIFISYDIFIKIIFPNLFPFLIISELLINYGFIKVCNKLFGGLFKKIFKISGNASFIFIMSILTGFPSSASYTKDILEKNLISENEANKVIMFTHFSNPLFIYGTISSLINQKAAIVILLSHYLGNIIIALFCSFNNKIELYKNINIDSKSFNECFNFAIKKTINTLLLIFGTITSFLIVSSIIKNTFHFSNEVNAIISGFLEITQGIKYVSLLNISLKAKSILISCFLSFGGICIHMQILSIINNTKIKYKNFLKARIFHAIISSILAFLL